MLDTPEKYGEFIIQCARIYHSIDPMKPTCTIITPYTYLEKGELYTSSQLEFSKRVDEYLLKQSIFADSIKFDIEPDGGLRATITHTTKKPIVNWPYIHGRHLIELLFEYHVAISMIDSLSPRSSIILRMPRSDIGNIDILGYYDTLYKAVRLSIDPKNLSFCIDANYFEVRVP